MITVTVQLLNLLCGVLAFWWRVFLRILRAYGVWCLCLFALSLWPFLLVWLVCRLLRSWRRRRRVILMPATTGKGEPHYSAA
jgi:hypothetical protein